MIEGDGRHHGRCDAHAADQVPPEPEAHDGRDEVGHEAEQADAKAAEDDDEQERNDGHHAGGAAQHAVDAASRHMREQDADARRLAREAGGVLPQPALRALVEIEELARPGPVRAHDQTGGRLRDVDSVVQIAAEWKRELVQQEVLGRRLPVRGEAVESRIIAVIEFMEVAEAIGFDPGEFIGRFDASDDGSHDGDTPCREAGGTRTGLRIRRVDR